MSALPTLVHSSLSSKKRSLSAGVAPGSPRAMRPSAARFTDRRRNEASSQALLQATRLAGRRSGAHIEETKPLRRRCSHREWRGPCRRNEASSQALLLRRRRDHLVEETKPLRRRCSLSALPTLVHSSPRARISRRRVASKKRSLSAGVAPRLPATRLRTLTPVEETKPLRRRCSLPRAGDGRHDPPVEETKPLRRRCSLPRAGDGRHDPPVEETKQKDARPTTYDRSKKRSLSAGVAPLRACGVGQAQAAVEETKPLRRRCSEARSICRSPNVKSKKRSLSAGVAPRPKPTGGFVGDTSKKRSLSAGVAPESFQRRVLRVLQVLDVEETKPLRRRCSPQGARH